MSAIARGVVSCALCFVFAASTSAALADATAEDVATAKALVKDGRALRDSGDHRSALEKFRAAYALVPTPITGLDLAEELASNGLLVEARETFVDVAKMPAKAGEKKEYGQARDRAVKRAEELALRVATLTIRLPASATGSVVATVTVSLDDREVPAATIGLPRKINPGEHKVTTRLGAGPAVDRVVTLADGEARDLELTLPEATAPIVAPAAPSATATVSTATTESVHDGGTTASGSPLRATGWAMLVGGAVGFGVGSYFALAAKSRYDESSPYCSGGSCQQTGLDIQADGRSKGTIATYAFVGGAALAAGGVVLLIVSKPSPSQSDTKPGASAGSLTVGLGLATISLGGSF